MNKPTLVDRRKLLRNRPTAAEEKLWYVLKSKQTGFKFRRQHSIGPFIVDFYCPKFKLVIELDGDSHFMTKEKTLYDQQREQYLKSLGMIVLRFVDTEIFESIDQVWEITCSYLRDPHLTSP